MAAEVLSRARQGSGTLEVDVFDAMPSVGRKFLLAGKGGLNLTHAEPQADFLGRYAERKSVLAPLLEQFGAQQLRSWAHDLGIETFVGTSSRVFPKEMKAAPLLRTWLHRLRAAGVRFHVRHRMTDFRKDLVDGQIQLKFETPEGGVQQLDAQACILAMGGASWKQLGSDGAWVPLLRGHQIEVAALEPSNCGFDVRGGWTSHLSAKFAGLPLKPVSLSFMSQNGAKFERLGEFVVTATGIEGSLVYAASALIRNEIRQFGQARIELDLVPAKSEHHILNQLRLPRASRSFSEHLRGRLGLQGLKVALLHEVLDRPSLESPEVLAQAIKALPLTLSATRPIDEAISSAGGVRFEALNSDLMLPQLPGMFCAGEMLDWEAPTGGYLLTACFSTGLHAGLGALQWLRAAH